jgi:hypothetical protein
VVPSRWQRAIAVVSVAVFLTTSCTSLQGVSIPAPDNPSSLSSVKVGDKVVVKTKNGKEKSFKVHAVEPDALVGPFERVPYADMASLNVEHVRKGPTIALVAIALLVVGSLIVAVQVEDEFNEAFDGVN